MPRLAAAVCLGVGCLLASSASAETLTLSPQGVGIAAGSLGDFTLTFPEFIGDGGKALHPVIEAQVAGPTARIRHQDGAESTVEVVGAEVRVKLNGVPADVRSWRMTLLLDIGFAPGGSWKIGEREGAFPAAKSSPPQIASLNATTASFRNAQGQSLRFAVPDYSFQQLTDNREWNWAVFHWQFFAPYGPDKTSATVRIDTDLGISAKLVDALGQPLAADFPNKVHSVEELRADAKAEETASPAMKEPVLDRFGGFPGSGERLGLSKTGYFHVERKGKPGQWWLVDPDGNAFFHLGVCGFGPNDDYTYVKGREGIYEWLPKAEGEFASAFRPGDGDAHFSFHLANQIRKFGRPYTPDDYTARMIARVRKWGFNSAGAFSPMPQTAQQAARFPYVGHLPINAWEGVARIPGAHEVWDPYDPATARKIAENLARDVPKQANDPLLIGWFIVNEPRYDALPTVIPALPAHHACKQQFAGRLQKKYGTAEAFNAAWRTHVASLDELAGQALAPSTEAATADVAAFVAEFLETYFAQVANELRKHDRNHLLLGSRLQPVTIEDEALCRIMGRHLDVISYNYYSYGVDRSALRRLHQWAGEKPFLLSEFFWASSKDSGLIGGREVDSQRERGLAYRNYVEQSAALGFVVGIEWFTLVDQATTGRWFSRYNGESYNTGLFSVADRPWLDMLAEMGKTNGGGVYEVLLGERPPFAWKDPRFQEP